MEIELILEKVLTSLNTIKGIDAIVLGGSRAKGNHSSTSDIDIGIYYRDSSELDVEGLNRAATELDDAHRSNLITGIGGWGPWINGGGWLTIDRIATDFLLRDLNKVSAVIEDCLNQKITIDYQPGHPHGFLNTIYAAEIYYCKVLFDPRLHIGKLKKRITPYPLAIKTGIVDKFLWEAGFSIEIAYKGILKGDFVYTAGCLYRAISCLTQVIYALNETYLMNEKGSLMEIDTFRIAPIDYKKRAENIFSSLTADYEHMRNLIDDLSEMIIEVTNLSRGYR